MNTIPARARAMRGPNFKVTGRATIAATNAPRKRIDTTLGGTPSVCIRSDSRKTHLDERSALAAGDNVVVPVTEYKNEGSTTTPEATPVSYPKAMAPVLNVVRDWLALYRKETLPSDTMTEARYARLCRTKSLRKGAWLLVIAFIVIGRGG